jgi:hypothetical protein
LWKAQRRTAIEPRFNFRGADVVEVLEWCERWDQGIELVNRSINGPQPALRGTMPTLRVSQMGSSLFTARLRQL